MLMSPVRGASLEMDKCGTRLKIETLHGMEHTDLRTHGHNGGLRFDYSQQFGTRYQLSSIQAPPAIARMQDMEFGKVISIDFHILQLANYSDTCPP